VIARVALLALLPLTAAFALVQRRRLYAIIGMALFSLLLASVFFLEHAPDVAITEAAVGAALVTFVYVLAIRKTGRLTVAASEVPRLIERAGDSMEGLEREILERLARRVGLDLTVQFMPIEEIEGALLRGDADIGAGGLILEERDSRLLRTPDHLPTARFALTGPRSEHPEVEETELKGYLSDIVDAVRRRDPVRVRLDLARFMALSRNALDDYHVERVEGEAGYAFAIAPSRADLLSHLLAILGRLRETGELDRMIGRHLR